MHRAEIVEIASEFGASFLFVASCDHHMKEEKSTYADLKYVDAGKDLKFITDLTKNLSKFAGI
jgi:uncharacterized protein YaiI (UPF0178 family)